LRLWGARSVSSAAGHARGTHGRQQQELTWSAPAALWRYLRYDDARTHAKRTRFEVALGKDRLGALKGNVDYISLKRTRDVVAMRPGQGTTYTDAGGIERTRWRNAQLPANTDTRQLRRRLITVTTRPGTGQRGHEIRRINDMDRRLDQTKRRGISRVLLLARHHGTLMDAAVSRSSAVRHDEGRHHCLHQSWPTRNVCPAKSVHAHLARYFNIPLTGITIGPTK